MRPNRKNPDPIDAISAHLKTHGASISLLKDIIGKDFNANNFESDQISVKKALPSRPSTGKKHFASSSSNIQ